MRGRRLTSIVLPLVLGLLVGTVVTSTRGSAHRAPRALPPTITTWTISPSDAGLFACRHRDVSLCELVERQVLTGTGFPWRTLGVTVELVEGQGGWPTGVEDRDAGRIVLFASSGTSSLDPLIREADRQIDPSVGTLRRVFLHEIGHRLLSRCGRSLSDLWRQVRGLPDAWPDTVAPPHDYDSVHEDYAEAFVQYEILAPSRSAAGIPEQMWLDQVADPMFLPGAPCPLPR